MGFEVRVRGWESIFACGLYLAACCALACPAATDLRTIKTRPTAALDRRNAEISPWERAERSRDAFEGLPEKQRSRADYVRVMDEFRSVYHESPRDLHAAEAVNAVAELLTEQGRADHDPGLLRAAVGQYEFLRKQYPGSSLRVGALLAQAQIEENDLHDLPASRERYDLLLKQYPRSTLAEEARAGLASLDAAAAGGQSGSDRVSNQHGGQPGYANESAATVAAARNRNPPVIARSGGSSVAASHQGKSDADRHGSGGSSSASKSFADPGTSGNAPEAGRIADGLVSPGTQPSSQREQALTPVSTVAHHTGPLATVTGIRHWSTPSYTRVAIDLGEEVEYEAARVPGPDRIYFDLHGAKLAKDLLGKSFTVTDDGFLKRIRVAQSSGDMARIVLDVNDVTEYSAFLLPNPYRLIIDIHGGSKAPSTPVASMDAPVKPAAAVPNTRAVNGGSGADVARLSDQPGKVEATSVPTSQPIAAVVPGRVRGAPTGAIRDPEISEAALPGTKVTSSGTGANDPGTPPASERLTKEGSRRRTKSKLRPSDAKVVGDPAAPARAAIPTADGQTSLVRALGLKIGRIVIDAGHGGHDSGTIGVDGLEEKDVVLDVALRLGKLLHDRLGSEVIYTRSDDTFIPLETRTALANKAQADLFLSIHANSSIDASARGVETYYLNFTQQADALAVAARENAVSNQSIYQLSDLVKKIALKEKIAESREFATDVEISLYGGLQKGNDGLKNRGVKKAPFVVLIGANMPSILAEISFVTNPRDANQLREPNYRERVAESLYKGVARYAGGLSGTKPSTTLAERVSGQ